MSTLRKLVREEIKKLIRDDALFKKREPGGLEPEFDIPGDDEHVKQMPKSCSICGTKHEGPCHNPAWDKKDHKSSYMAKPQLYRIVKNASEIFNMLEDNEEMSDWMESYISQADQMIGSVHEKMEYKESPAYQKKHLGPIFKYED